ncbi:MAG: ATP-binding protein [Desulfobacterales bacterium]|nr:ATP-binding protein [Desulfobacterales bacterium]
MDFEQKTKLVDALTECSAIKDNCETVVSNLPKDIRDTMQKADSLRIYLFNIITKCMEHKNGLEKLIKVVEYFEGDSIPIQKVYEVLLNIREVERITENTNNFQAAEKLKQSTNNAASDFEPNINIAASEDKISVKTIDSSKPPIQIKNNPYRVGGGLTDNFIGRQRELKRFFSYMKNGMHIAVIGDRTIGKTTFINQFCAQFHDSQDIIARIDGQFISNQRDFFKEIITEINKYIRIRNIDTYDKETFRELLYDITASRTLIIIIDEFDLLTTKDFDKEFFNFLRAVGNDHGMRVLYITVSKTRLVDLAKLRTDRDISSPFFNIFNTIKLNPFTNEEVDELLGLSLKNGIDLQPYRNEIIRLGGYFPYFLQIACWEYFTQLQQYGTINEQDIIKDFRERAEDNFKYIIDGFNEAEEDVIFSVANEQTIQDDRVFERLKSRGYLIDEKLFSVEFQRFCTMYF